MIFFIFLPRPPGRVAPDFGRDVLLFCLAAFVVPVIVIELPASRKLGQLNQLPLWVCVCVRVCVWTVFHNFGIEMDRP